MPCKITLIGAGSVVFAKTLIGDILQFPELSDAHICLMDISPARLKVADIMMKKIVAKLGVKARVESTSDQRKAIKGAKYVICTVQVGGYQPSTRRDFDIPKKYGLEQTIADTLGVGGVFRGLRTIPVINSIAQDIADHAHPDCLFLNYSNPMAMNCWAVDEGVGIPHVGLCHSVFGTAMMLASHAGLPYEDVSYLVAGVNHMAFFLKFQYRGQDAYPLLFKVLEDPERNYELVRYEMMRRTGYFVTESSEHQSEYLPYFIHHGKKVIDKFCIPIDEYLRRCEAIISTWQQTEDTLLGKDRDIDVSPQSHEYGSYIIHSRETDTLRTVYGNVPNDGLIDNLTQGCCVEVPCQVDATGLNPLKIGALPEQLAALCMTNVNVQRLTVEAALTKKREHIYHAVMADPHASSTLTLDQIWSMCDELIEAHQKDGYLGEFAPTIKDTGRSYAGVGDRVIAKVKTKGEQLHKAGNKFTVIVEVENPGEKDISVPLLLSSSNPQLKLEKSKLKIAVKRRATAKVQIQAKVLEVIEEPVKLQLDTDDSNVLAIGNKLLPRRLLEKADDGLSHFKLQLAGFDAAVGSLKRTDKHLEVRMRITDSDIKPNEAAPHKGSVVELFFASEDKPVIKQVFAIPGKKSGVQLVYRGHNKIPGASVTAKRSKIDYSFTAKIPLSEIGVAKKGPFLFDVLCTLSALGDAHSGGRCSLGNNFGSFLKTEHYHQVNP